MKITLISPQVTRPADFSHKRVRVSPFFPLGMAYLAAAIVKSGNEVIIRDYLINFFNEEGVPYHDTMVRYGAEDKYIIEDLKSTQADVVGISCLFSAQEFDSLLLCNLARKALPNAFIVIGGPHGGASSMEFMKKNKSVDGVVEG